MAIPLPDEHQLEDVQGRALRGKDLLFLRQWLGLSIADCCYLLGMPLIRWPYYQQRPDSLIQDAGVAMLARALLTHPEVHYLPRFPTPAEILPAYRRALAQSSRALADPDTALGLLLGRDRTSAKRWLNGTGQRQVPPPVSRLLLALQTLLLHHGVPGFEALVDRAAFEAAARGIDLFAPATTTWARRAPYRPRRPDAARPGRPPRTPRPESDAAELEADPVTGTPWWTAATPPPEPVAEERRPAVLPLLARRPMTRRDVRALQSHLNLPLFDLCYLLGHPLQGWEAGAWDDDRLLPDPALALLVWGLTHVPAVSYVPAFPTAAEVVARYRALASSHAADWPMRQPATSSRTFSLLVGREVKTAPRWWSPARPEPVPPLLRRVLSVLDTLLERHGSTGLEAWIARANLEAAARGVDLRTATVWARPTGSVQVASAIEAGTDAAFTAWLDGLAIRPVCGHDLRVLQERLGLTPLEAAYQLGLHVPKYRAYLDPPDRLLDDPALSLLVWALLTYPETRFLAAFPAPADVYPLFRDTAAHCGTAAPFLSQYRSGTAAFGVLLGRSPHRMTRWQAGSAPQPAQPVVVRLLAVLRELLQRFDGPGLDAWVEQVGIEATARGLDPTYLPSWEQKPAAAASAAKTAALNQPPTAPRAASRPRK